MKKLLSTALAVAIAVTSFASMTAMAEVTFPDIDASHWAMSSVSRLVSEGTINGFEDGTFRPEGVVSRAEFVKMLGKSDVRFESDFADVPSDHWAYDYIMYSCLDGDANGNFNPAAAITRGDVANLLYKRFADGAETIAPSYITSQGNDSKAAAWVYNTGLMVGGDMLNLRLDDTLTRAEAAVLIVRATDLDANATRNFIDNFSDDVYKIVYEGSNLFDTPYEAEGSITREELAVAAMRFQNKYRAPTLKYNFDALYDSNYSKYWGVAVNYALDEQVIEATQEEAMKSATVEEAISMLTLGAKNNEFVYSGDVVADGKTYPEVTFGDAGSAFASNMSYAYRFGISLYADGVINPAKPVTKKEVSCIILQYSLTFGSHMGYSCGYNAAYIPLTTRLTAGTYPSNSDFYPVIAEEIPNNIYETSYAGTVPPERTAADFSNTASAVSNMFTTPLMYMASDVYDKGAEIYLDFFPALTCSYGKAGDVMRVRLTVNTAYEGMKLSDIAAPEDGVEDRQLSAGDILWIDINTNQYSAATLYLDYTLMTVGQIID